MKTNILIIILLTLFPHKVTASPSFSYSLDDIEIHSIRDNARINIEVAFDAPINFREDAWYVTSKGSKVIKDIFMRKFSPAEDDFRKVLKVHRAEMKAKEGKKLLDAKTLRQLVVLFILCRGARYLAREMLSSFPCLQKMYQAMCIDHDIDPFSEEEDEKEELFLYYKVLTKENEDIYEYAENRSKIYATSLQRKYVCSFPLDKLVKECVKHNIPERQAKIKEKLDEYCYLSAIFEILSNHFLDKQEEVEGEQAGEQESSDVMEYFAEQSKRTISYIKLHKVESPLIQQRLQ